MQMQPMMAGYYPNNVTSDHIQQVLFFFCYFYFIISFFIIYVSLNFKWTRVMKSRLQESWEALLFCSLTTYLSDCFLKGETKLKLWVLGYVVSCVWSSVFCINFYFFLPLIQVFFLFQRDSVHHLHLFFAALDRNHLSKPDKL